MGSRPITRTNFMRPLGQRPLRITCNCCCCTADKRYAKLRGTGRERTRTRIALKMFDWPEALYDMYMDMAEDSLFHGGEMAATPHC